MSIQKDAEGNESRFLHLLADFKHKRVLEIGCGEGRMTWQYARAPHTTIGIDTDTDALRIAKLDRPVALEDKVFFASAASEYLPFSKETFDIAVLAWSL